MRASQFLESLKAPEQKSEEAAEQFRSLFEEAPVAYHQTDRKGIVRRVNRAECALLGLKPEEILGKAVWELLVPEQWETSREAVRWKISGKQRLVPFERAYIRRDGSRLVLEIHENLIRDARGKPVGIGSVLLDITEHKQLEEQLRQAQKMEALGLLAGGTAHDFNNAMLAVLGWTELALQKTIADPVRRHLQKIQGQARHAAGLSRQLLAFANHRALEPCRVNLNQTVARVIGLLENTLGHGIRVETGLAPNLEQTWAVPAELEQVLINLCLNASDAMPDGGCIVIETHNADLTGDEARAPEGARPGRYVVLAVSDNGTGMNATTTRRMFEPFFTTKQAGQASGLGLTVVQGIVKQHGGFIDTKSEPKRGTRVHLYFPGAGNVPHKQERKTEASPAVGGTETILVAEDHEAAREVARETLATLGYQVLLAHDGQEAVRLAQAQRDRIRLVILDVLLPRLSGPGAYARMCAVKPHLPVIFTTGGSAQIALPGRMMEQGAAVLEKPYSTETLGRKVRELLDCAGAPTTSAPTLRRRR